MKENCSIDLNGLEPNGSILSQKITLNERLVIHKPLDWIRDAVINDNTFANPKFADAQKYGRSTRNVSQNILTYYLQGNDIVVDRGYCREFFGLLKSSDIACDIEDKRCCPSVTYPTMKDISLRPYQRRAVEEALRYNQGCIIAPTGSGKTVLGLELVRCMGTRSLIIVHKKELADQWQKEVKKLFGLSSGLIGSGKWGVSDITIGMVQTLSQNKEKCHQMASVFGMILCDECHHCPCETFAKVIGWFPSKYKFGLSATPERRDHMDFLIYRNIGPVVARVTKKEVEALGSIVPATIKVIKTNYDPGEVTGWQDYVSSLDNAGRNLVILDLIAKGGSVLVLTDRVSHAISLSRMLNLKQIGHTLAHGELPTTERATLMHRIKDSRITIGTVSLLGEGLDVSHWSTLILGSPISSEARLLQAIGRILRPGAEKEEGIVYDLHDDCGFSGNSLKSRMKIYEKHGIKVKSYETTEIEK